VARLGTPRARRRALAVMLHGGARPDATEGGSGSTPFDRAPGNGDLPRRRDRGPCQPAEERRPDLAGPASPPSPRIRGSRGGGLLRTGGCSAMEKRGGARSGPVAALPWATPSPPRSLGLELGAAATVATDPRKEDAERGGSGGRPRRLGSGSSSRPLALVPLSPARQGMGLRSSRAASSSTRCPPYPHPVLRRRELRPVAEVVRRDGLGGGASSTSSSSSELPRPPTGCVLSLPLGLRASAGR
jgi:hypothetical protein